MNEKKQMNFIEVRAMSDLQYALFCANCATRYLDSRSENVKKSRNELMEAMNNFYLAIQGCFNEEN